ncbi:MAG: hypothetical protein HYT88_00625 [Candidatus Omnitrophica bacterium]|nr:hypothetical protein [Candidatus Omnitrophota bacterium]
MTTAPADPKLIGTMKFASGVSDFHDASSALENACRQVREQLGELSCDAAFVFTSAAYEAAWEDLLDAVHRRLSPRVLIGCSGSGIIGAGRELERGGSADSSDFRGVCRSADVSTQQARR